MELRPDQNAVIEHHDDIVGDVIAGLVDTIAAGERSVNALAFAVAAAERVLASTPGEPKVLAALDRAGPALDARAPASSE